MVFILLCVFRGLAAQAGTLEALSKGAFYATGNSCESYNSTQASQDLRKLVPQLCDNSGTSMPMGVPTSVEAVNELSNYLNSESEDQLFALLANQQSKELKCAADFSSSISNAKIDDPIVKNITEKLELARVAKQKLALASQKLATDPNVSSRLCPLELGEGLAALKAEFPKEQHSSVTFKRCQEILTHRQAYNAIVGAIPLSGVPEVQKYVDEYTSSKTVPTKALLSVYQQAEKTLQTSSNKLKQTLGGKGAQAFKRQDRYQLLSDPGLATQALKALPEASRKNMQGLLCQADSKYGKGADALDSGVMALSLAFSGGVGLLGKSGMYVTKAAALAGEARSAGVISLGSMRILQASALALDTGAAIAATNRACSELLVSDIKTENACTSAPNYQKIEQEDCILTASLTALGYASVIPPSALKLNRIKNVSNAPSKQSAIWKSRTLGNRVQADKLEAEIQNTLTNGKIVETRRIGNGITDPSFVRFEDGTEGIWKSGEAKYANSKSEIAAYKLDKELGANIVPVTVERRLDGVDGTVQVRVTSLRNSPKEDFPDELSMYDYLMANEDRSHNNYLHTSQGQTIAIDHSLAFEHQSLWGAGSLLRFNDRVKKYKELGGERAALEKEIATLKRSTRLADKKSVLAKEEELKKLKLNQAVTQQDLQAYVPDRQVIEKLRGTSRERWQQVLGGELTDQQITELYGRQKKLIQSLDEAEAVVGRDRLYRAGPSSPVTTTEAKQWD